MGGTAQQLARTAADGRSMPGPAKHPSFRHPTTIRYVQPRPAAQRAPSASGRMRRDTLLSPGRLALPPFPAPPLTISPGARPIIS
eukprot:scaffold10678_cov92-Isochrysis_galbana.AAC.1